MLAVISAVICFIIVAAFTYLKKQYRYWKDLGIPGPEPVLIFGNMSDIYKLKSTEALAMDKWYKEFKTEPYIGIYNLWKPTLLVKDPELIKAINEVDFAHFTDHPPVCVTTNSDAIMDSLFTMRGSFWKAKRQIFSKLFAPRKLKEYCDISNRYGSILLGEIDAHSKGCEDIPLEEIAKRHMIRTASHITYSLDVSKNEEIFSNLCYFSELFARPPFATVLKFSLFTLAPRLFELLRLRTFSREFWDFFSNLTNNLLQSRKEHGNIGHEDCVSIVADMQKEGAKGTEKMSHSESVGHIFCFFMAGHGTSVTMMTYILYQLSRHQEIQEKVFKEVENVLSGEEYVSYDDVMKMKYLENVINETLRRFTLVGVLKRTCTIPYKLNDKFTIPKDMDIAIPAYSLHMDPQYFSDPEEFIPERFSNLDKLPSVFMPFGKGPRTCLGKRMGYVSLMVSLAKVISKYKIMPGSNTECPFKYDPKSVIVTSRPLVKLTVKMQKRQKEGF